METRVYRNCVYYEIGRSPSTVWFKPHHSLTGAYRVVYQCSIANWDAGTIFNPTDSKG